MKMILLGSAEGPGKESGSRGRWRGNPGIQFDLPQLSPRLCSSRYVSKVLIVFVSCHGRKCSLEQRYMIMFCAKLRKSGSKMLQLLRTAYGDVVLSSAQVLRWHKVFKDGRESVEDEERAGRPSTSRTENNVARVKAVLDRDRRECAVNRRGVRTTKNGHPPNHYGRSAREKFRLNWSQRIVQ